MSSEIISKRDFRKTVIALAFVGILVASFAVTKVDAAPSPVTISSDKSDVDILVGETVDFTLTLDSSDTTFTEMQVYLIANWQGGNIWTSKFYKADGTTELPSNTAKVSKNGKTTVILKVSCVASECSVGQTNKVSIYGKSDPTHYDSITGSLSTTDPTPATTSNNVTNTITIDFEARTGYDATLTCNAASDTGDTLMYQGIAYLWGYTLKNTGWSSDSYSFDLAVSSSVGHETGGWALDSGLTDGKALTGQSGSSDSIKETDGKMSITPAANTKPGVYDALLTATSAGDSNVKATCAFEIIVPEPDFVITDADIEFSHTGAWINTRGESQRITITATVRNNGGSVDSNGNTAVDVEVNFFADGTKIGSTQAVPALSYGDEKTVQVYWNPSAPNSKGVPISVVVDPSNKVEETAEDNNKGDASFKVVQTQSSSPSFYLGFLALAAAVGTAAFISNHYRNKEDSEE